MSRSIRARFVRSTAAHSPHCRRLQLERLEDRVVLSANGLESPEDVSADAELPADTILVSKLQTDSVESASTTVDRSLMGDPLAKMAGLDIMAGLETELSRMISAMLAARDGVDPSLPELPPGFQDALTNFHATVSGVDNADLLGLLLADAPGIGDTDTGIDPGLLIPGWSEGMTLHDQLLAALENAGLAQPALDAIFGGDPASKPLLDDPFAGMSNDDVTAVLNDLAAILGGTDADISTGILGTFDDPIMSSAGNASFNDPRVWNSTGEENPDNSADTPRDDTGTPVPPDPHGHDDNPNGVIRGANDPQPPSIPDGAEVDTTYNDDGTVTHSWSETDDIGYTSLHSVTERAGQIVQWTSIEVGNPIHVSSATYDENGNMTSRTDVYLYSGWEIISVGKRAQISIIFSDGSHMGATTLKDGSVAGATTDSAGNVQTFHNPPSGEDRPADKGIMTSGGTVNTQILQAKIPADPVGPDDSVDFNIARLVGHIIGRIQSTANPSPIDDGPTGGDTDPDAVGPPKVADPPDYGTGITAPTRFPKPGEGLPTGPDNPFAAEGP